MKKEIKVGDIQFRQLKLADAPVIVKQVNQMHKLYKEPAKDTLKSVQAGIRTSWSEWKTKKRFQYGIVYLGEFVGTITLTPNFKNKRCELGYYISPSFWGKGLIYKILKAMIKYLFKSNFNKVYFRTKSDSPRSWKSLEKLGAKREGTIRAYFYEKGKPIDAHYYGILKKEFKNLR